MRDFSEFLLSALLLVQGVLYEALTAVTETCNPAPNMRKGRFKETPRSVPGSHSHKMTDISWDSPGGGRAGAQWLDLFTGTLVEWKEKFLSSQGARKQQLPSVSKSGSHWAFGPV